MVEKPRALTPTPAAAQPPIDYPELDEFVVATVRKIMPFGAICGLDEYRGLEAFIHISEVSTGWVRTIREKLREGQKIVAKIIFVDRAKNQVDLSLKRVSEAERKRKLAQYQAEKRGLKLFEHTAKKLGKPMQLAWSEAGNALIQEFGGLYAAFEALSRGEEIESKISRQWVAALEETAKQEIKEKKVEVRALLRLQSFASNGVDKIKSVLDEALSTKAAGVQARVHYVSAPLYYLDVTASDYKRAEKFLQKISGVLEESAKKQAVVCSLERQKKQ